MTARQTNTVEKRQAQSAADPGHIQPHLIAPQTKPEYSQCRTNTTSSHMVTVSSSPVMRFPRPADVD
jgi:hypothetical protein